MSACINEMMPDLQERKAIEERQRYGRAFREERYFRDNYLNDPFAPQFDVARICQYIMVETRACKVRIDDALRIINVLFTNMHHKDIKRLIHDLFTNAFPEYEIEKNYSYDMDYLRRSLEEDRRKLEEEKRREIARKLESLMNEKKILMDELNSNKENYEYFKDHVKPILREIEEPPKDFLSEDEMEV